MSRTGPVIVIENDVEEKEIMEEAYNKLQLKNRLCHFSSPKDALQYLVTTTEQPLVIISEIRFPGMDGIELRKKIQENPYLRSKSIPFIFLTGDLKHEEVQSAYELQVQGYFLKKYTLQDIERVLRKVIDYWMECVHPNAL